MPYRYSIDAIEAAHTALLGLIDGAATPGKIKAYTGSQPATVETTASGTLLGTIILADPAGTVSGTTGALTMNAAGSTRDESADATGTIGYVRVTDGDDVGIMDIPVQAGTEAVSGYAVFNTLSVTSGTPIELVSLVIG